ncbi:MAG TPA: S8 family serine peptidase [Jatrophihabitantaceae bacterium]
MRVRPLAAAAASCALLMSVPATTSITAAAAAPPECNVKIGSPARQAEQAGEPWEHKRLNVRQVWPITDGSGVLVAVIDSGFNNEGTQLSQIHLRLPGVNVSGVFGPNDVRDCFYHGTAVTGIIAAPRVDGVFFTGVAPGVTILPIKEQQSEDEKGTEKMATAIDAAIAARARVVNISISAQNGTPDLERAIAAAARADIVIVAAGGNDGQNTNQPAYPAAYSTRYPNVLAVSMTDRADTVSGVSTHGNYINIAAPGAGVEVAMPKNTYAPNQDGTSFASPVVAGTAALVRAAHPKLTAAEVVSRIEATADAPPGVTVPSASYGYGIVNPYLAVTAVRNDAAASPPPPTPQAVQAVPPPPPASRHLQHLALGVSVALLGLAVLAGLIAAIVRRGTWFGGMHAPAPPVGE